MIAYTRKILDFYFGQKFFYYYRIIHVPLGTMFRNVDTREVITELTNEGSMFLAARGGAGGKGNAYFKCSENQKPMLAEAGGEGEEFVLNVGKSDSFSKYNMRKYDKLI
jgi:hypothetical protein